MKAKPIEDKRKAGIAPKRGKSRAEPKIDEEVLAVNRGAGPVDLHRTRARELAAEWLFKNTSDESKVSGYLEGFHKELPVFVTTLPEGTKVRQFVRFGESEFSIAPGDEYSQTMTMANLPGNWFGIAGSDLDNLTLTSGSSGRLLVEFVLTRDVEVLEGYAAPGWMGTGHGGSDAAAHQSGYGIGEGGASQFFFPDEAVRISLRSVGNVAPY